MNFKLITIILISMAVSNIGYAQSEITKDFTVEGFACSVSSLDALSGALRTLSSKSEMWCDELNGTLEYKTVQNSLEVTVHGESLCPGSSTVKATFSCTVD